MTKKRDGQEAQQIGDILGGLIVKAQAKAGDKTRKPRAGAKITPAGIILTEQDQKLIEAGRSSIPLRIVAPVVVNPETASK